MHDFKRFPELTDSQMVLYYFQCPHKQIFQDFTAVVVKVIDGDTVRLRWKDRDFNFPLRLVNIAAPENREKGGEKSQNWLERQVLGKEVNILVDPKNRVEKWGRLLGRLVCGGLDLGEMSVIAGHSVPWEQRGNQGGIPDFGKQLEACEWLA